MPSWRAQQLSQRRRADPGLAVRRTPGLHPGLHRGPRRPALRLPPDQRIGRRRQGGRRRRPPADRDGVRGRAVPPAPGSRGTGRRTGPDHRPGRRGPGPPRRGRLRRLPRQPARPGRRPRSGTPAALPRAGLVLAAPAGGRIVHRLRRLRRPRPGPAPARLSGTVLKAGHHICALTGQPFTVAAVRTAGFEADLCLAGSEHPGLPAPGNIISGTVVLSAAIDAPI